jgi:hypothetical protein
MMTLAEWSYGIDIRTVIDERNVMSDGWSMFLADRNGE